MKGKDAQKIWDRIDQEGFDYTFISYSDFKAIDDEQFHKLRKAYVKAHDELKDYIGYEPDNHIIKIPLNRRRRSAINMKGGIYGTNG